MKVIIGECYESYYSLSDLWRDDPVLAQETVEFCKRMLKRINKKRL